MASRNHPPDDELLESARSILTTQNNRFEVKPWREIMTKAHADQNAKAMKAAAKKITPVPKHIPNATQDDRSGTQLAASGEGQSDAVDAQPSEADMQAIHAGRRATDPIIGHLGTPRDRAIIQEFGDALRGGPTALLALDAKVRKEARGGDCAEDNPAVESGFSIFNQTHKGTAMTDPKTHSSDKPETKLSPDAQAKADAAVKAAADKAAKKDAAAKAAVDAKAAQAAKQKERAETVAANKLARDTKAAELTAAGRTYTGTMTQLAERVKAGAYVKSMTGQLRSSDELAVALDAVPAMNVVILGLKALKLAENPYAALNIGQQSMNLRNRMRGAIKKGTLTLTEVKDIRDKDGLATAEAEAAKKQEAKALRLKTAAEAQTLKLANEAKALEAKQAKEAEAIKAKTAASAPATPATKTVPAKKTSAKAQAAA